MQLLEQQPLRIAILMADYPPDQTQKVYGHYGRMFNALLTTALSSLKSSTTDPFLSTLAIDCRWWDVCREEQYPNLEDIDVAIITGSRANAFDNLPWILKLVSFSKKILYDQDRIKLIGVCFGHQIIARAMGLPVDRNPLGWEISVTPIKLTPAGKKLLALGEKDQVMMHQMHRDFVACRAEDLPNGVVHLGQTGVCAIQGMYHRDKFISVQAHPEFNEDIMWELLEARKAAGVFTEEEYKDGMARRKMKHDGVFVAKAFLRFAVKG